MKTVITYGTFDLFHIGHLNLLKRAKELGDYLIVAVSSDEFNLGKGKVCKIKDTDRMAIVEAIKYVDKVILPNSVKYIYDLAFSGFNKVEGMDVPDGVIVGTNILGVDTSTKIKGDAYQIIDGIKFKSGEGGITRVE